LHTHTYTHTHHVELYISLLHPTQSALLPYVQL